MPGDEAMIQLSLFTPHRLALGEAWDALAVLDVDRAARLFDGLVASYPDSREAVAGAAAAHHWSKVFFDCQALPALAGVSALWGALCGCPEKLLPERVRLALLQRLWSELETANVDFLAPDLPAGRLAMALGHPDQAAPSLARALRRHPDEPVILDWAARVEWELGRTQTARTLWTRLLLIAPQAINLDAVADEEVKAVIRRRGAEWAAVFGFIDGVLPLLPAPPESARSSRAGRAYESLAAAEKARGAREHDGMVAARLALRSEAPDVLTAYLDRLERQPPP